MKNVYVVTGVGARNGLAYMICNAIKNADSDAFIVAVSAPWEDQPESEELFDDVYYCNLSVIEDVPVIFGRISEKYSEIYCLINCAGANRMDWFENVIISDYNRVMNVNSTAPIFATQALLGSLSAAKGTVLNIISMGAHRPFRTSLAYNVSKAALKMATHQLAREITPKHGVAVFGISPNELAGTGMTLENLPEICRVRGWTPEQAEEYRVKVSGQASDQTDPRKLAEFISYLLCKKENHKHFNGVDIYYGD
jgi:NAD(P)-dependent dehydrogenase (short-subunit alcohol dehydrogenase family)